MTTSIFLKTHTVHVRHHNYDPVSPPHSPPMSRSSTVSVRLPRAKKMSFRTYSRPYYPNTQLGDRPMKSLPKDQYKDYEEDYYQGGHHDEDHHHEDSQYEDSHYEDNHYEDSHDEHSHDEHSHDEHSHDEDSHDEDSHDEDNYEEGHHENHHKEGQYKEGQYKEEDPKEGPEDTNNVESSIALTNHPLSAHLFDINHALATLHQTLHATALSTFRNLDTNRLATAQALQAARHSFQTHSAHNLGKRSDLTTLKQSQQSQQHHFLTLTQTRQSELDFLHNLEAKHDDPTPLPAEISHSIRQMLEWQREKVAELSLQTREDGAKLEGLKKRIDGLEREVGVHMLTISGAAKTMARLEMREERYGMGWGGIVEGVKGMEERLGKGDYAGFAMALMGFQEACGVLVREGM